MYDFYLGLFVKEMNDLHMYLVEDLYFILKIIINFIILNHLHAPKRINPVTIKSDVNTKQINGPKPSTNNALSKQTNSNNIINKLKKIQTIFW